MISIDRAKQIALENKPNRILLSCNEMTDSWVFSFAYKDGTPAFDGTIRVYKETGESKPWNFLKRSEVPEFKAKFLKSFNFIEPKPMV